MVNNYNFATLSPGLTSLFLPRQFLSYVINIGSRKFRRAVVEAMPWGTLQEVKDIVDRLHTISKEIYDMKVMAFEKGDDLVTLQVGQGKDIMSVLRQSSFTFHPCFVFRVVRLITMSLVKANRSASEEDKLRRTKSSVR